MLDIRFRDDDIQRSPDAAGRMVETLCGIRDGTHPPMDGEGNAWHWNVDAKVARLTCYYATPVQEVELPTAWLIDALERWRDHLIAKKR